MAGRLPQLLHLLEEEMALAAERRGLVLGDAREVLPLPVELRLDGEVFAELRQPRTLR